jgi:hypothetical protein
MPYASFSSGVTEAVDVEKLIIAVKDHDAIYDALRCEHRNRGLPCCS